MRKTIITLVFFISNILIAQKQYNATKDKVFDLIHTKLKVAFDFSNSTMNGEAWVKLKPHFYKQNKLILDAKAMLIHKLSLDDKKLTYTYDKKKLFINLPKTYSKDDELTVYIKYTAQPEKVQQQGSKAITDAKGLYFIDPKDEDPEKPTQIWTQGETEANSCWFPTIDTPNQKMSQEIYITVPNKFVTLSNGILEKQTKNSDGTRTDYWNFKQKHAPYLFFMGIGEYEIIKDKYKSIPVDYYVEKKYAPYAKEIFGDTPEMISFFSKITGIEYPWEKYSQIIGRDYVSGAMENTTAVIHGEQAYQVSGQLIDDNRQETTIAHEIFHHWFGNLVTTESWSNLTVNESFANYSEYLWLEHKYGKSRADAHLLHNINGYKRGENYDKHLVRFYYDHNDDMFDAVSYNKGGAILHMLRNYIGDDAFFKGLNNYLTTNKFKTAEAHQLRLAFEEVSGKDLTTFFNQWFFGSGHPKLKISYDYNKLQNEVNINIKQDQEKLFSFPLVIDLHEDKKVIRKTVFIENRENSINLKYNKKPKHIQINADAVLLCDITETKLLEDYINQYNLSKEFKHKKEALEEIVKHQETKEAFKTVVKALEDESYIIRKLAAKKINLADKSNKKKVISKLIKIAKADPKTLVRGAAIETLGKLTDPKLAKLFKKSLKSKSYSVLGKSLVSLYYLDKKTALEKVKNLPKEAKETIATSLTRIYLNENIETDLEFIAGNVLSGMYLTPDKEIQAMYGAMFKKIATSNNHKAIKNLTKDIVKKGKTYKSYGFDVAGINMLKTMVNIQEKTNNSNKNLNIKIIKKGMENLLKTQL